MAKIEISLGSRCRSGFDRDASRRPSRPSVRHPTGENRSQMAPSHLQGNFACPPLVSAWDCEVIVNTFPMSAGNRGDSSMPPIRI
jgi:hypothetical protein